ncbi:serine/threonine-protein kinase VRK1 isoform X1 [Rhipicephalus sanguineus]|uniref:serine/threonine-protein kinase VRK1 isoform X1 n=1 Tax=Rhipicephalus sanguineus TaxID=34632 RepID=UPI0020C1E2B0|nr:serine/threonine-protein kinase VRK1 isoform X1 [Rhipicephalus sanguineus]
MPKRAPPSTVEPPKKKAVKKAPRVAANGHRLPDPLPAGEVLTDLFRKQWRLGKAVGLGGFGEIYLASDEVSKPVDANAAYVIKIEPHSNGPLFTEINFYLRVGKAEQIDQWVKQRKLDYLGMPRFRGSGSHEHNGVKYRFMVMDRFGEDLQKILDRQGKTLPLKTAFSLGMRVIDVLEYVHSYEYIHADVKGSNLLLGFGKGNENKVYLVDFGLACRYTQNGKHKEYKEDLRKAHDGTIEFTSRDAHIGAHSRRGDIEILGYNLLQWLCCRLPWEDNLKNPEYVSQQKSRLMEDIPLLMSKCFPHGDIPCGITEFLQYVASMKFEDTPDYKRLKRILEKGIQAAGFKPDGRLLFTPPRTPRRNSFSPKVCFCASPMELIMAKWQPKKPVLQEIILAEESMEDESGEDENVAEKPPPAKLARGRTTPVRRNNRRSPAASKSASGLSDLVKPEPERKPAKKKAVSALSARTSSKDSRKNGFCEDSNSMGLDNPTPAMLEVLQRKQALLAQQQEGLLPSNGRKRSSTSPPANHCPSPPWGDGSLSPVETCDRAVQADDSNAPRPTRNDRAARKRLLRTTCSTACQTEVSNAV